MNKTSTLLGVHTIISSGGGIGQSSTWSGSVLDRLMEETLKPENAGKMVYRHEIRHANERTIAVYPDRDPMCSWAMTRELAYDTYLDIYWQ